VKAGRYVLGALLVLLLGLTFVLASPRLQGALVTSVQRQVAKVAPPRVLVIGDSLGRQTCWACRLRRNPFSIVNLAQGGVTVSQTRLQAVEAKAYRPAAVLIVAGTNDVVLLQRTPDQIAADFGAMLDQAPPRARLVVTLIPYTGFVGHRATITQANQLIAALAQARGAAVIDLNSQISRDGIRRAEYTSDGVHLTDAAYDIWAEALAKQLLGTSHSTING
jgi:hypothetical protein